MNRKLVIGDIHGGLKALRQVLEKVKLDENDKLIFLGDYVDGWSESPQVLDFLIELGKKQTCIFIRGNHDDLLLQYLKTKKFNNEWFLNGGKTTVDSYENINQDIIEKHILFLENLVDFYIDDKNNLFVHAGFTNIKGVEYEYFKPLFYWDRTLWELALSCDENLQKEDVFYPNRLKLYTEIFIGHTPTTKINKDQPFHKMNVWNVDTGAAFKGKISILDCDTKVFWQSDLLPNLYPLEKGRN